MSDDVAPGGFATYQDAVDYLFAMVDYEKITSFKYSLENFDLRRTENLLDALGSPHKNLKLLHIAGTKGKGSTAHIARSLLTGCGFRTGCFTSPHLVNLEERITIDGRLIDREDVRILTRRMRPYVDNIRSVAPSESPTFFELMTGLGMLAFVEKAVDFAVIEVGMGGRLDSTNVITPLVSVITRIDFDHVKRLGPTLGKIAGEKAGIIKPGVPLVCARQQPEALEVILNIAEKRGAQVHLLGRDFHISSVETTLEDSKPGCIFDMESPAHSYKQLALPMLGEHQAENAALAIRGVELMGDACGFTLTPDSARNSLLQAKIPARIEIIPGEPLIILDGGHNLAAVSSLVSTLKKHLAGKRIIFVFGVAADKDVPGILRCLLPLTHRIIFTRSDSPRAVPPDELLSIFQSMSQIEAEAEEDAAIALQKARNIAKYDDVVCVTGSLYLAGNIRPSVMPGDYKDKVQTA